MTQTTLTGDCLDVGVVGKHVPRVLATLSDGSLWRPARLTGDYLGFFVFGDVGWHRLSWEPPGRVAGRVAGA